jgi:hypothetical protein
MKMSLFKKFVLLITPVFAFTIFLVVIHLEFKEYHVDADTNERYIFLEGEEVKCYVSIYRKSKYSYKLSLGLSSLNKEYIVDDLQVKLNDYNSIRIKTIFGPEYYEGKGATYSSFAEIPDSMKILDPDKDKSMIYKYRFNIDEELDDYEIHIKAITKDHGVVYDETVNIERVVKLELDPHDTHNGLMLVILFFIFLSSILLFIIILTLVIKRIKKKKTKRTQ